MSGLRTDFSECSSLCTCSQQLQPRKPFLIGVSGGTASGKSTVCQKIVQQLGDKEGDNENNQRVSIISLDSFYKDLSNEENELALLGKFDFDHPRVFDYELLKRTLLELMNGNTIEIFDYDHKLHKRNKEKSRKISSADVVLVEGILVFYQEDVRALFNIEIRRCYHTERS
ncbi:hypothetical protein HELRODRAFT_188119 [Helobdella robusta]|uniref:Phosphoribulokinase/uridine kinase domain-containing protein n=1 Tax=Helobdella robusta TaxID=6412 RepID=T1FPN7_HELRO|nr:hypothetical protein HELRODRAFT_188119 [Helobdella robusta]ESO13123.1 hypothetical protein HELRODRAFT_188119 [Helobdella robusta]